MSVHAFSLRSDTSTLEPPVGGDCHHEGRPQDRDWDQEQGGRRPNRGRTGASVRGRWGPPCWARRLDAAHTARRTPRRRRFANSLEGASFDRRLARAAPRAPPRSRTGVHTRQRRVGRRREARAQHAAWCVRVGSLSPLHAVHEAAGDSGPLHRSALGPLEGDLANHPVTRWLVARAPSWRTRLASGADTSVPLSLRTDVLLVF